METFLLRSLRTQNTAPGLAAHLSGPLHAGVLGWIGVRGLRTGPPRPLLHRQGKQGPRPREPPPLSGEEKLAGRCKRHGGDMQQPRRENGPGGSFTSPHPPSRCCPETCGLRGRRWLSRDSRRDGPALGRRWVRVSLIQLGARSALCHRFWPVVFLWGDGQLLGRESFKKLGQLKNFQNGEAAAPNQLSLRPFSPLLLRKTQRPQNLSAPNTPTLFFRLDST